VPACLTGELLDIIVDLSLREVTVHMFERIVLRAEQCHSHRDVQSFEGDLSGDGVFERATEVRRGVEHPSIIDVGDVDPDKVITLQCHLWGFHCHTSLARHPAHSHFGHAAQQADRGYIRGLGIFTQSLLEKAGRAGCALVRFAQVRRQFGIH
jgi:hypothetical protein